MRAAVSISDLFITISAKMKEVYKEYLGKDSIAAVNMSESLKQDKSKALTNDKIEFVYAGGFQFNRDKILELLAKTIEQYNNDSSIETKLYLKIYSNTQPTPQLLSKLNIEGSSIFGGALNFNELKKVLNECDIPVHVEAFDRKSIESTRLSISTKIPEYLSLGKPILAIGPQEVASMEYLKNIALCVNDCDDIYRRLMVMITDEELRNNLSEYALKKYNAEHNVISLRAEFRNHILQLTH